MHHWNGRPDRTRDRHCLHALREMVTEHGWVVADLQGQVCEEGVFPAIAYTVGLAEKGHPEIVMTGRMPEQSITVLNMLASRVQDGLDIAEGERWRAEGLELEIVEVGTCQEWLRWTHLLYPHLPVRGLQAVWADANGLFPWEQAIPDDLTQPLFGRVPRSDSAA